MDHYVIGVDSGGSHSHGVLLTQVGHLLAEADSGPASVCGTPFPTAIKNLTCLIRELLTYCHGMECADVLYAGISGGGIWLDAKRFETALQTCFPQIHLIRIGSDAINPLYGTIGDRNGIIAIAGTGSGAYAHINGEMFRIDLDGYLFGDEAGGFSMGRNTLNAALRMQDGRMKKTVLYDLCVQKLGGDIRTKLDENYVDIKSFVAGFAPLCYEAMAAGDPVAKGIIDQAVESIKEDIWAAAKLFPKEEEPIAVVLNGGLWQAGDGYMLNAVILSLDRRFNIQKILPDPAMGAAVYAATLAGRIDIDAFRKQIATERGYRI